MCQYAVIVSSPAHTKPTLASSASLTRWGSGASCLAGISCSAWGYLDNPDASEFVTGLVVPVLAVTTSALFLGGLAGLYSWNGSEGGSLRRAALVVGLVGTVLGVFDELDWWEPDWWSLLFFASTAAGLEMVFWEASQYA